MKREIPVPLVVAVLAIVALCVAGFYWQRLFGSVEHHYGGGPPAGVGGPPRMPPPGSRGGGGPPGPPPGPPPGAFGR